MRLIGYEKNLVEEWAEILAEASSKNTNGTPMSSSLQGDRNRTLSHFKTYVAPYLDPKNHKKTLDNMEKSGILLKGERQDMESSYASSEKQDYDAEGIHHKITSGDDAGDNVRIKHVEVEESKAGKNLVGVTHDGRRVPLHKVSKPAHLARTKQSMGAGRGRLIGAGEVESNINRHFGKERNPADTSGHDAVYPPENPVATIHERKVPSPLAAKMEVKGSTKCRMGDGSVAFNTESKRWEIRHGNKNIAKALSKAVHKDSGLSVLDHLNKFHPDGRIDKGLSFNAKNTGIAKTYLDEKGSNCLHLHNNKTNKGTTYTYGDELEGRVGLHHLSEEHVSDMDGVVRVEKGVGGSKCYHVPAAKHLTNLAHASSEDGSGLNLHDKEDAEQFKRNIDRIIRSKRRRTVQTKP